MKEDDDDDDIFGKPVASEIRKVKDPRAKGLARVRIQSVLFEAQFSAPPTVIQQGGYKLWSLRSTLPKWTQQIQ